MSLEADAIRTRIATALAAIDGWRESPLAWGLYGRDPDELGPKMFAVGVPETVYGDPRPNRGSPSGLAYAESRIAVRWTWTLPLDGHVTAYSAGAAIERTLRGTVLGISAKGILGLRCTRAVRVVEPTAGKYLIGDLTFTAAHMSATTVPGD